MGVGQRFEEVDLRIQDVFIFFEIETEWFLQKKHENFSWLRFLSTFFGAVKTDTRKMRCGYPSWSTSVTQISDSSDQVR
jgi:hypothetical protein